MTAPSGVPATRPAWPDQAARAAANCAYVRRLLMSRQPGFAMTLELAISLPSQYLDPIPRRQRGTHQDGEHDEI